MITKRSYPIVVLLIMSLQSVNLKAEMSTKNEKNGQYIREEFDISEYWYDGLTWKKFLEIRNTLRRVEIARYLDKIEVQKMARKVGLEMPKTYLATREKMPIVELLSSLESYVAKPTHLSNCEGLIIVKGGKSLFTDKLITPEEVEQQMHAALEKRPRKRESWILHQVPPGFMVQEYIPNREEIQIQTIWGKALIGAWRGGESKRRWTPFWGKYARDGTRVFGDRDTPKWWNEAIQAAEKIAQGTDALRVDFLVREDGTLLLNELAYWVETDWSMLRTTLEDHLNDGYRRLIESRQIDASNIQNAE